jgi:hypothetical protein
MMRLLILAFVGVIGLAATVQASKEGILALSSFSLESTGIGASGPVEVSGKQDTKGIVTIRVKAFGKEYAPSEKQLAALRNLPANGIQLSYEAGYRELGGRTIYLLFTNGFTSGVVQSQLLAINETGEVKVAEGRDN